MKARLLVSLIGIPALLVVVWAGFPLTSVLVGVVALAALWEFYGLAKTSGKQVHWPLGVLWTVLFVVNGQLAAQEGNFAPHLIGGGLLIVLAWTVIQRWRPSFADSWIFTVAGPLYVGFLLSHALMLREGGNGVYDGRDWLLYVLFMTFAADTGAFLVGRVLGKHKMAPVVSPGKTWEGLAGGLVVAVAASMGLSAVLDLPMTMLEQALLGLLLGVVAPMGDLLESALKRRAGVKDSGVLVPGHGGVLDRIDSLLITLPVTYYIVTLIIV